MKGRVAGVVTLAALMVAATTSAFALNRAAAPIVVGAVYPVQHTSYSEGGEEEYAGAQLAMELTNRMGGIHGRQVRFDLVNTPTPEAAPAAVAALRRRGISTLLGTYNSTISVPAAAEAARRHMVLWETGAVGLQPPGAGGGTSFFRLAPMGQNLGIAAIAFVRNVVAPQVALAHALRYAVVNVDDVYGQSVGDGAVSEIARAGLPYAGRFPYDPLHTDFGALVTRIAAAHPDVLMVVSYLDDGEALRTAMLAAHLPLVASIGTSSAYCSPDFGRDLGAAAVGLFASDKPAAADVNPSQLQPQARRELNWAMREWKRRHHNEMQAHALSGFANAWALLHHVLPASTDLRPSSIAAAALRVKLPEGALPNANGLDIAPPGALDAGANRRAISVIWEWVGVGQRAVVWPPAYANAPVKIVAISS